LHYLYFMKTKCMLFLSCVDVKKIRDNWTMIVVLTCDIKEVVDNFVRSWYKENSTEIFGRIYEKKITLDFCITIKGNIMGLYSKIYRCYKSKHNAIYHPHTQNFLCFPLIYSLQVHTFMQIRYLFFSINGYF